MKNKMSYADATSLVLEWARRDNLVIYEQNEPGIVILQDPLHLEHAAACSFHGLGHVKNQLEFVKSRYDTMIATLKRGLKHGDKS